MRREIPQEASGGVEWRSEKRKKQIKEKCQQRRSATST